MRASFLWRRINLWVFFLACPFFCIGQGNTDLFEYKWKEAQGYLQEAQMEVLLVAIKQMEPLIEEHESIQKAQVNYLLGEYWHEKEDWKKVINYSKPLAKVLKKDTSQLKILGEVYFLLGSAFHELEELDTAIYYHRQTLAIRQQFYGHEHQKVSDSYFNLGFVFQEKDDLINSDKHFLEGLNILKKSFKAENSNFADFYEELGYNASYRGNFEAAISYLQKAIPIKEKELGPKHEDLIFSYKYLGEIYKENEYYGESIVQFNKALEILEQQIEGDIFQEGMLYFSIGKSYFNLGELEKAYSYFDKAIGIDKNNKFSLFESHRCRGEAASKKGDYNTANIHFDIASKGFKEHFKINEKYLSSVYESIIQHLIRKGDYQPALDSIEKALKVSQITFKDRPIEYFDLLLAKGICYRQLGKFDLAKKNYQKAWSINGGQIDKNSQNIRQLKQTVSLNLEYAKFLQVLANNTDILPHEVDSVLNYTIELISYINRNYQERSTKENFIETYHEVFCQAIRTKKLLFHKTGKKSFLAEAFVLSEKSQNLILLETIKNVNAFNLAIVPKAIAEKEKALRVNITHLENKRFEENQNARIDKEVIYQINGEIYDLKKQRQTLIQKIEKEYPDFYQMKFEPITIGVQKIQASLLDSDQSILEFFVGIDSIYTFLIKKAEFLVYSFPKAKDFSDKINEFRSSIYSYRPSAGKLDLHNDTLIEKTNNLGYELYQTLWQPFQEKLSSKVTIVADEALGYLPFDALITQLPSNVNQFQNTTYLLDDYQISYAYSVNWLNSLSGNKSYNFEQNFVGVAPEFQGTYAGDIADFRLGLGPLKYNQEEVENIQKYIGGTIITGINATRNQFLNYLKKGQILHLATHGKANDQQGDYSYLAFAEPLDTADRQFLYVQDLFNLEIPADLIVLSACETGLGEIKRGEGIVGIGKGFSYAGAKSLVTTLWRVSDNSTANFMPLFYQQLKAGLSKDEALWKAKKEFLQTNRNVGHPFFWSGYVAYGNMEPIVFQHSDWTSSTLVIMGFFMLILLLFIGWYKFIK